MNKKFLTLVLLVLITILGGSLRLYKIAENPPSLTGDEISFGYSAYSVLKTGKDENGVFMPLTFQSVGDYKNPLPGYLMILPIKLFGLNDFSVRLPNALFGTLMIFAFFFFLIDILKNRLIALLGAFLMSVSSWHIFYSRYAYETLTASLFVLLGVWCFIKMLKGRPIWAILSAFFLVLTMYTAFAPRLFIPVFVIMVLVFSFIKGRISFNKVAIFVLACIILGLPLAYVSLFQHATTRLSMVFIANDIEFIRYGLFHHLQSIQDLPLLLFFWLKRYLNYLQPDFIFLNGLSMTLSGTTGLGLLYPFELPLFILGIVKLIKGSLPYKAIFVIWLLVGIVPDSLTNNQQHSGRLLQILPVVILINALGLLSFSKWISNLSNKYIKIFVAGTFSVSVVLVLIHAFLTFTIHFPRAKGESFDEGLKQVALYIQQNKDHYKEIIVDPNRGIDGPYMVSNPYLYLLFYSKYDPLTYQTEPKVWGKGSEYYFKFDKYTFRAINWIEDGQKNDILLIGSPWSLPEKLIKKEEILQRIYLSSGQLAFLIVAPKPNK